MGPFTGLSDRTGPRLANANASCFNSTNDKQFELPVATGPELLDQWKSAKRHVRR